MLYKEIIAVCSEIHIKHTDSLGIKWNFRVLNLVAHKVTTEFRTLIKPLTPNDPYRGRTAQLTSKRCILYIYSTNIGTEYFKHVIYSPFFFSSKCSLFHISNVFGSCIIHILYTDKSVPLQAWSGPEGSRKLRLPDFVTTAQAGGKVVSLTHRPPLPPGNTPDTHFF